MTQPWPIDEMPMDPSAAPSWPLSQQVYGLYRQFVKEREAFEHQLAEAENRRVGEQSAARQRLAKVAAELHQIERCVASVDPMLAAAGLEAERARLRLLVTRFKQVLAGAGVELPPLEGAPFEGELQEMADVIAAVPGPCTAARIKEVVQPLVRVDGEVALRPTVITEVPG